MGNLRNGRRPDHLRIEECCDTDAETAALRDQVTALRPRLANAGQLRQLDEWLARQ